MQQTQQDPGRNVLAVVLIGTGVVFLLGQVLDFDIFGALWPFLVILPGVPFLVAAARGERGQAALAVPGVVISGTGLILLYQNATGHWESWAYAWLLYPVFLGFTFTYIGRRKADAELVRTGDGFIKWGGAAFLAGAIFFELLIFRGGGFLGTFALPLILIGLGLLLLFRGGVPDMSGDKSKRAPGGPNGPKTVSVGPKANGSAPSVINPDLQRRIDEALAEDDDKPKNG